MSGRFQDCRVYQEANASDLPDGLALQPKGLRSARNRTVIAFLLVILITLLCIGALINGRIRAQNQQAVAMASTMTHSANLSALTKSAETLTASAPTITPTPTVTRTITPTASSTPEPTSTYTPRPPTQGPGLETSFGANPKFLIHQVQVGESIQNIARTYQTSETLILAINQLIQGASIRPDMYLVIIPEKQEYPDLPVFQPVFLEQDTTVTELAAQYNVSSDDLRRFNGFGEGDLVPAERWIVIPFPSTTSP